MTKKVSEADLKAIGQRVRKVRVSHGLTQNEICENFSIGRANYSRIEKGEIFPNYDILRFFHLKWGINIHWILLDIGTPVIANPVVKEGYTFDDIIRHLMKEQKIDDDNAFKMLKGILTEREVRNICLQAFMKYYYRNKEDQ